MLRSGEHADNGFAGFHHFRRELRGTYLGMLQPLELMEQQQLLPGDVYRAMILRDFHNLQELLRTFDAANLNRIASLLVRARRVVVMSSGSYAASGLVLSHLCTAFGMEIELETRGRVAWAPRLASLSTKDLVVGISFWRCDPEAVAAVQWAAGRGIKTVAITDSSLSSLAQVAHHRIVVPTEGMLFTKTSFQVMLASASGGEAARWPRVEAKIPGTSSRLPSTVTRGASE